MYTSEILNRKVIANPKSNCPKTLLENQIALKITYINFNGQEQMGVIEIHRFLAKDLIDFFHHAYDLCFPINQVLPASDSNFMWNDDLLMEKNISSGFNYRLIGGGNFLSKHAFGAAFDINPLQNPYIRYENGQTIIAPTGSNWDTSKAGTLYHDHPLVKLMISKGWSWGGDWLKADGRIDYQHFDNVNVIDKI